MHADKYVAVGGLVMYDRTMPAGRELARNKIREWRKLNPEKVKAQQRRAIENRTEEDWELRRAHSRAAYAENPMGAENSRKRYYLHHEEKLQYHREYRASHPLSDSRRRKYLDACKQKRLDFPATPEFLKSERERTRKFKREHPPTEEQRMAARAYNSVSHSTRKKAVPPWVDRALIEHIYTEAYHESRISREKISVDHIYPIRHPRFSGLHVPCNLQFLTLSENCSKNNRVPPAAFHPIQQGVRVYTGVQL